MAIEIPTTEPTRLYLGASALWKAAGNKIDIANFPASEGWHVNYFIRGQAGQAIDLAWSLEVTADGEGYAVEAPAAKMAGVDPGGHYKLYGRVDNGFDTFVFYEGDLELAPNPAGTFDSRTHVQKVLDAIEATIEGRASREETQMAISFGGTTRQLGFVPFKDLMAMRAHYRQLREQELAEEAALAGLGNRRRILTHFTNA